VFYIPQKGSPGPHPHVFSTDAEIMYKRQFAQLATLDQETSVTAYLE
jgi:hypothetical protein